MMDVEGRDRPGHDGGRNVPDYLASYALLSPGRSPAPHPHFRRGALVLPLHVFPNPLVVHDDEAKNQSRVLLAGP